MILVVVLQSLETISELVSFTMAVFTLGFPIPGKIKSQTFYFCIRGNIVLFICFLWRYDGSVSGWRFLRLAFVQAMARVLMDLFFGMNIRMSWKQ